MTTIQRLKQQHIVAVVRTNTKEEALLISRTAIEEGIHAIEITLTTPFATEIIEELTLEGNTLVGAGSVLTKDQVLSSLHAGAKYIVSPTFTKEVYDICTLFNVPYIPGCMTVQEITNVRLQGCEMIKLFPASTLGPDFIKAIKAPLPNISIMATGGININNMTTYLDVGCDVVGVGSSLTKGNTTKEEMKQSIKKYRNEIRRMKNG